MVRQHKHKGVERSDTGALRAHSVDIQHKDSTVKRAHDAEIASFNKKGAKKAPAKKVVEKQPTKKAVKATPIKQVTESKDIFPTGNLPQGVEVKDDYIYVDTTQILEKGVRVKFVRHEGNKRRLVGLEIKK